MKIRKDLIIVALATFCLTVSLFMILPTKSNQRIGEYDAWKDLNEDGTVDIFDTIAVADGFGTSGDPTKNVNVTNWPPTSRTVSYLNAINVTWTNYGSHVVADTGSYWGNQTEFSRMSVEITVYEWKLGGFWTNVTLDGMGWAIVERTEGAAMGYTIPLSDAAQVTFYMGNPCAAVSGTSAPIVVRGPLYVFGWPRISSEMENGWLLMNIVLYFRNE